MRRHNRNPSPRYSVIREKSSYTESESEIAKGNRYRVDRYSRERASPDYREEFPDGRTKSPRDPFNTLLIRRFSSKLDDSAIQEYIFNDFDRFGELSVRMGTYAGERAAFINFK
ncbi:unnamed protein product [Protopolystoma xenopodis]|uniref:Uncharacterized protein n=1 Tax=Protopolystoma xenopodis TaxID=117903 RepID=A0A3S5ACY8_9PLAT|nr:unnamed protein product [Protopolystoma xenopodis]